MSFFVSSLSSSRFEIDCVKRTLFFVGNDDESECLLFAQGDCLLPQYFITVENPFIATRCISLMVTSFQVPLDRSNKESDTNLLRNNGYRESHINRKVRFFDKFSLYLRIDRVLVERVSTDEEDSEGLENKVAFIG